MTARLYTTCSLGFRYTNTKDYITETEYGDNVQMIPASSQTPRINQRMPELFEDATIIAKRTVLSRLPALLISCTIF